MHEIVIVQRMDALYQYYGIYLCEHWIGDNLIDTFISLKTEPCLDKSVPYMHVCKVYTYIDYILYTFFWLYFLIVSMLVLTVGFF